MIKVTDPHLHLFNLSQGEYGWLQPTKGPDWPDKSKLLCDFKESDLRMNNPLCLAGYVHIEAGFNNDQSWLEVDWVEAQAILPVRTIGCVDLCLDPTQFIDQLTELARRSSLVGVRHIFDDQLNRILSHPNTIPNLHVLESEGIVFELQFNATQLSEVDQVVRALKKVPSLSVVLNHQGFGSSALSHNMKEAWLYGLTALSELPSVKVKCSGLEMLDRHFTPLTLKQTLEEVVSRFGQSRVMMASNFPLVTLSMSYEAYWLMVVEAIAQAGLDRDNLVDLNARETYRF